MKSLSLKLLTQNFVDEPLYDGNLAALQLQSATSSSKILLGAGIPLRGLLTREIAFNKPDIIHDHGIWLLVNHMVAKLAAERNILRVVHPRGMLEPWAMSYHSHKKKCAWSIYQKKDLESAALFVATAASEADSIRNLGFKQPIAIIPNGVDLPEYEVRDRVTDVVDRTRNVVYMSRVHPKKGLIGLIDAWAQIRPAGWKLVLAGPDQGGHLQDVMSRVNKHGLESAINYRGAVEGHAKAELLKDADVFILPSLSENFGVVVAEALSFGLPVIATLGTPWKGLVENGCGWWVAPEKDALVGALSQAMALNDEERHEMGIRGRHYSQQFDWWQIARETADVYRWLLGHAERPNCVKLD